MAWRAAVSSTSPVRARPLHHFPTGEPAPLNKNISTSEVAKFVGKIPIL